MCQKFCATRSGPTYSNLWSGKSAEVTSALTPGNASAFDASIERIRAWACGERMTLPWSVPAVAKSAPYIARPVTFGTPSGRIGRVPTHLNRVGAMSFIALLRRRVALLISDYRHAAPAQKQKPRTPSPFDRHVDRPRTRSRPPVPCFFPDRTANDGKRSLFGRNSFPVWRLIFPARETREL